jgi:hypothetical protein
VPRGEWQIQTTTPSEADIPLTAARRALAGRERIAEL